MAEAKILDQYETSDGDEFVWFSMGMVLNPNQPKTVRIVLTEDGHVRHEEMFALIIEDESPLGKEIYD